MKPLVSFSNLYHVPEIQTNTMKQLNELFNTFEIEASGTLENVTPQNNLSKTFHVQKFL